MVQRNKRRIDGETLELKDWEKQFQLIDPGVSP